MVVQSGYGATVEVGFIGVFFVYTFQLVEDYVHQPKSSGNYIIIIKLYSHII